MSDFLLVAAFVCVVGGCVYLVARAGNRFGHRGALLAAAALWVVLTLALQADLMFRVEPILVRDPQRYWLYHAALALISLLFIVLPMLLGVRLNWMRGRLLLGLIGALVVSLLSVPLILFVGCAMGIDCI